MPRYKKIERAKRQRRVKNINCNLVEIQTISHKFKTRIVSPPVLEMYRSPSRLRTSTNQKNSLHQIRGEFALLSPLCKGKFQAEETFCNPFSRRLHKGALTSSQKIERWGKCLLILSHLEPESPNLEVPSQADATKSTPTQLMHRSFPPSSLSKLKREAKDRII